MNTYRLNVGVIGLGVGEQHLIAYQNHPDCVVKAVCDFDYEIQKRFSVDCPNIKFVKNPDEILCDSSIDVVTIASWDNYHYEQIIKGLENGKHIFVEKPICLHEHQAKHIAKLLKEDKSLQITSNLILRKSPRFKELKNMIKSNKLGNLFSIEGDYNYGRKWKITEGWRGKIGDYSGVYGGGVHIIDLFQWLTGEVVDEVFSYGNNICLGESGYDKNDYIIAILKFKNGMNGKFSVNLGCVYPHFHRFSLYGTKGTFENDYDFAKFFDKQDPIKDYTSLDSKYPGVDKGDLIENFISSIKNGTKLHIGKKDIFNAMSVCFAIEKSLKTGNPEKINYIK